jgi:hypothetical protein
MNLENIILSKISQERNDKQPLLCGILKEKMSSEKVCEFSGGFRVGVVGARGRVDKRI